jgi:hypothetical protein
MRPRRELSPVASACVQCSEAGARASDASRSVAQGMHYLFQWGQGVLDRELAAVAEDFL